MKKLPLYCNNFLEMINRILTEYYDACYNSYKGTWTFFYNLELIPSMHTTLIQCPSDVHGIQKTLNLHPNSILCLHLKFFLLWSWSEQNQHRANWPVLGNRWNLTHENMKQKTSIMLVTSGHVMISLHYIMIHILLYIILDVIFLQLFYGMCACFILKFVVLWKILLL